MSDVFVVRNVPIPLCSLSGGIIPRGMAAEDALYDSGAEALIALMDTRGLSFYKSAERPDGIVDVDDVVVVKVNAQWNGHPTRRRTHTNTDVLKGLLYRIVGHPSGFVGTVIVADNTQWTDPNWDSSDFNNAEDHRQSYQDVVDAFVSQGHRVCIADWREISAVFVGDFHEGDEREGYVLVDDPGEEGRDQLSYPKFTVRFGSQCYRISMRHGLWDGHRYMSSRLKMINLPVLKRHGWAGATIAIKNYIGFTTTADNERRFGGSTEMHGFFWGHRGRHADYGLLGRQIARIRRADLEIVDAVWVATGGNNRSRPRDCRRLNSLLCSTDPVALDYYASSRVLAPTLRRTSPVGRARMVLGRSSPRDADAAARGSRFRSFLLTNAKRLRREGMTDVIDLDDAYSREDEEAQIKVHSVDATTGKIGPSSRGSLFCET